MTQADWDAPVNQRVLQELIAASGETDRARLLAVSTPESWARLNALPSAALGNHLTDCALRIAVALRLGIDICQPHTCKRKSQVEANSHMVLNVLSVLDITVATEPLTQLSKKLCLQPDFRQ